MRHEESWLTLTLAHSFLSHTRTVSIIGICMCKCVCVCVQCKCALHLKVMAKPFESSELRSLFFLSPCLFLFVYVTFAVMVLWLLMNHLLSVSSTSLEASRSSSSSSSGSDSRLAVSLINHSPKLVCLCPWQQTCQP